MSEPSLLNEISTPNEIKHIDGLCYLQTLDKESINLVLTDPPYITSRKTGMDEQAKIVKKYSVTKKNLKTEDQWNNLKTAEQWNEWMIKNNITEKHKQEEELRRLKSNYLKSKPIR